MVPHTKVNSARSLDHNAVCCSRCIGPLTKRNCLPRCKADCAKNCYIWTSKWFKNSTLKMGAVQANLLVCHVFGNLASPPKLVPKNNTKMRATWKRTFDSWVRPASSCRTRRGGGSVRNLLRRAPHPCRHLRKKFCWILTVPRNGRMSFTRAFKSIVYGILCKQTAISFLRDGAAPNES